MNMRKMTKRKGFSLVELIIAFTIIVIILAAVLPQFHAIKSSFAGNEARTEVLSNGRVLDEHFTRYLAAAAQIISVTPDSIIFKDNNDVPNQWCYKLAGGYIVFGTIGNEQQLAGPVEDFRITCYSLTDLQNPTTDANNIRFVKFETNFSNPDVKGNKNFSSQVFIQANTHSISCWQHQDVGSVAAAGSASSASCVWTINGSGVDIWDNADGFHYVYQNLSGDGQIIARVVSMTNTNSWAKAGVMIRESLTAGSKHAMMVVTPGNGTAFQCRTSTGFSSDHYPGSSVTAPYWVKIIRSGNTLSGYESADGSNWTQVGSDVTISMAADIYIGMCVTSHNDGVICTAEFDNISFSSITLETLSSAKAASSSAASLTINKPAGTAGGNLLIAAVASEHDASGTITMPGWTLIDRRANGNIVSLASWWKIAGDSEPANYTCSWAGGRQAYGWIMRFTGHNGNYPINTSDYASSSGVDNPESPAVSTTVNNCMILRLGAFDKADITAGAPGLAVPLHTAITMDSSGGGAGNPVAIVGSWLSGITHAKETSGNNHALIFIAHAERNGSLSLNSVTYGGQSMTKIVEAVRSSGNPRIYVTAFILDEAGIDAATNTTFALSWNGNPSSSAYSSVFLQNVNQTTLTGAESSNTSTSGTTISASALATVAGDMVIDAAACSNTGSYTVNNGFTESIELTISSADGVAGYKFATGANETPSVTHSTSNGRQSLIGFVVQAAGAVSGGAGYIRQSTAGGSGTSNFQLAAPDAAQMLTIAIAPDSNSKNPCCDSVITP